MAITGTQTTTAPRTTLTLEQQRAEDAWRCATACHQSHRKEYENLAKNLPALIMNSGLLQVLAFLQEKRGTHEVLAGQLRRWIAQRFPDLGASGFAPLMQALMKADSPTFQAVTTEAMAWLRWLRQIAPAVPAGTN